MDCFLQEQRLPLRWMLPQWVSVMAGEDWSLVTVGCARVLKQWNFQPSITVSAFGNECFGCFLYLKLNFTLFSYKLGQMFLYVCLCSDKIKHVRSISIWLIILNQEEGCRKKTCLRSAEALFARTLQVTLSRNIYQLSASNVNVKDLKRKGFFFAALQYMEMQDCHYELFMFRSKPSLENWQIVFFFLLSLVLLYRFDSDLTSL